MAEVVVCLQSVLALQEKASYTLLPAGMRIFGKKVPSSSSDGNKSVGSKRSLELYFDTIGGENIILRKFEFETINVATENFSQNNKIIWLGKESILYKGRLEKGLDIIVRCYSLSTEHSYKNDVAMLVKLEHENLPKLLGYSIEGTKVFLVYEFAFYASLGDMIRDHECTLFDWYKRNKIILAVARVLSYLHQHGPFRIIHADINAENILLDESLEPILFDFGVARCLAINEADCIVTDKIYGTPGYIAADFHQAIYLSTKADVYSFGALILVTITGMQAWDRLRGPSSITQYVLNNWVEGTSSNIIDPRIHAHSSSATRVIHIGLLCTENNTADRPTMEEVVGMLTNSSLTLHLPLGAMPPVVNIYWPISPDDYDDYDSGAVEDFISELCGR
ncbi:hypothetical protein L1887_04993 [Cichorium endivia]|nr:hypothetical protein L1887_04993 [Cichorium endivia]